MSKQEMTHHPGLAHAQADAFGRDPRPGAPPSLVLRIAPMKQRYSFTRELGSGGFGQVFLAQDQAMGREVAIKLLTKATPDALERFEREARILYRELNNKYIVDLLDHDLGASP